MLCERKMLKERLKAVWYWLGWWICKVFCILFFRLRVYGRENVPDKGAFILVSNHQSYLDPLFCGVPLKRRLFFVARDSLWANWFLGWAISLVSAIPVKQDKADFSAIREVIRELKEGMGVCLFPEGTRTSDGKIASLKSGFSLLCRRGEAAIVPVVIEGAFECWPRHKKLFSPGVILVCYGKKITAEEVKDMGDKKLAEVLTDTLRRMQTESRIKHGKEPLDY